MPFHFRAEKAIRLGINYLKEVVMKSPIALLVGLFHDLERLNPGVQGLDRDIETIKRRFENEGYGFLAVALPALGQAFLEGLSTGKFTCPRGFKLLRGRVIPRFLSGMLCEVFEPVSGHLKEVPDQGIVTDLHQICRFFKKTRLSPDDADYLHHKAVDEFYQCDGVAAQVIIPERHDHLIGRVSKLILNTLNSKDVENAAYKHGPGAVKEGYSTNQKWLAAYEAVKSDDPELQRAGLWGIDESVPRVNHAQDSANQSRGLVRREVVAVPRGSVGALLPKSGRRAHTEKLAELSVVGASNQDGASRSSAKLISVEKDSSSRRTITVEPMLKQFVQQGLNILLRDSIKECRILRNSIALTDQTFNQKLALEGSRYDNWATIDLKSASDLLSVSLVKSVFQNQEPFLGYMMDCRAPVVTCVGKPPLVLGKFAGMGNALTFPVQSICFAVVCIAAILDADGTAPSYWNVRRASRRIRVYGDDIIIQRKYAHQCVNWLIAVGLKVNSKKSFLEGNFKESCGVDAFRGVDITPLYIRHRPDQTEASPNVIASFIELSNHLWLRGLYAASTCLRNEVERALGRYLPLVSRWSGAFGWHTHLDAQTVHTFCKRTHRFQTRTLALASIKKSDRLDGYPALFKCLVQARLPNSQKEDEEIKSIRKVSKSLFPKPMAKDTDHLDKTSMRYNWRIKPRWVPTREGPV